MIGRIGTSATVGAITCAMVLCGTPVAYADDGPVCNGPVVYATGTPGTAYVVGEIRAWTVSTAHWACTSTDTDAAYWMTATLTVYAFDGVYFRPIGESSESMHSVAGTATVHPTVTTPARPGNWHYVSFSGSAAGRRVVSTSGMYYVP